MFYNNSSDEERYTTSYSEDERYAEYLLEAKKNERLKELQRQKIFEEIGNEQEHIIFNTPGLTIMKFNESKIKFSFQPSIIYEHISNTYIFYCSLRYLKRYKKWIFGREPMPAKPIFHKVSSGNITDDMKAITKVILKVYKELTIWSEDEIRFRRTRYEEYRSGKLGYLDMDSIDQELYFSEDEKQEMFEKRQKILKRMIPPPAAKIHLRKRKETKLKYFI